MDNRSDQSDPNQIWNWNLSSAQNNNIDVEQIESIVNMKMQIYRIAIPLMLGCFSISFVANGLVLISGKWLKKKMMSPNLRLCISLAAADSWTAALMLGGLVVNSLLPMLNPEKYRIYLDNFMCVSLTFELIRISAMLTSDWHLFALALNQCYSIFRPLHYKVIMTTTKCRGMIMCLWILPVVVSIFSATLTKGQGYRSKNCTPDFYFEMEPFRLTIFLLFTLPLVCTCCIYAFVLHRLWRVREGCQNSYLRRSDSSNATSEQLRRKKKAVATTLLIVGTFGVSWFPLVLCFFLICREGCYIIPPRDISPLSLTILGVIVNNLVVVKLLLNPLIYALRILEIRIAISIMFSSCFGLLKSNYAHYHYRTPNRQSLFAYSFNENCIVRSSIETKLFNRSKRKRHVSFNCTVDGSSRKKNSRASLPSALTLTLTKERDCSVFEVATEISPMVQKYRAVHS